ncbi:1,2-phenylacetyl-CoA epoxidase subunit PaaE [Nocardiopsis alkaliphila]|uniref:1,2-phenylacetyl-CoA epoxidase subunit PaaE n=1 Tax=Nocardiopsis alkaliphila TaxID=225762 RepID=UPI00034BEB4B|nr:1,2-phenylacetyl-CoA epoxidase subunit PaaE [Nocardiopsis alkaliphila]
MTTPVTETGSVTARGRAAFHRLRVSAVERLCEDAVAVTFDVPDHLAEEFAFAPGQSLTLRREIDGVEERRSYSICSAVGEAPRVGVRLVADGLFSTWLVREVAPGDEVEVGVPTGRFSPDLTVSARHVLVAAGSGITPVLSMAASLLRRTDSHVTLLYGNRRSDTVMFADELADLKDVFGPRLELVHVLSREPREAELFTGRLDGAKLKALLSTIIAADAVDHWWLCGPYEMVTDAQKVLSEHGVAGDRVHQELFFVEGAEPPPQARHADPEVEGPASEVTVVLDGRTTELTLPRGVPVLDSAQRYRPDLPFACKGGVCGTCRVKVCGGEVEMVRNYALTPAEVDAGYALACQSLPITDTVTVDFDS